MIGLFVTSPVSTAMEITCLIHFRRSAASRLSLYQVLSLFSLPGVELVGGGGSVSETDEGWQTGV